MGVGDLDHEVPELHVSNGVPAIPLAWGEVVEPFALLTDPVSHISPRSLEVAVVVIPPDEIPGNLHLVSLGDHHLTGVFHLRISPMSPQFVLEPWVHRHCPVRNIPSMQYRIHFLGSHIVEMLFQESGLLELGSEMGVADNSQLHPFPLDAFLVELDGFDSRFGFMRQPSPLLKFFDQLLIVCLFYGVIEQVFKLTRRHWTIQPLDVSHAR